MAKGTCSIVSAILGGGLAVASAPTAVALPPGLAAALGLDKGLSGPVNNVGKLLSASLEVQG